MTNINLCQFDDSQTLSDKNRDVVRCVVDTVVLPKVLSCSLLEKDAKDDVSIDRYLPSKSEIGHRNHKSSQTSIIIEMIYNGCSHYLLF